MSSPRRAALAGMMLALGAAAGCGDSNELDEPYRARIVAPSGGGDYDLKTVKFKTLNDPDSVDGSLAAIRGGASLDLNAEIGEIVTSENPDRIYADRGEAVKLDYIAKDGTIYPKNFASMAMLAIYYNYETTFLFWKDNFDLSRKKYGKLNLYYNPKVQASDESTSVSGTLKINAAFFPGPRDFWFFKTSRLEDVPINMNLGIMAHEFSHGIFDHKFADQDPSVYQNASSTADEQLSGINEGLADYFAFVVTGSVKDFGASLKTLDDERAMPVAWTYSTLSEAPCSDSFYCKGSILASALHEIAGRSGHSRVSVGQVVYDSLGPFREDWDARKNDSDFDYHYLLNRILEQAEAQSGEDKTDYCEVFAKWFDLPKVTDELKCS